MVMICDGKLYTRNGQVRITAEAAMPPMRKLRRSTGAFWHAPVLSAGSIRPARLARINLLQDAFSLRDCVGESAFPRRAWLVAYPVELPCCQDRCGIKDCVFPLLVH